ncbi:MAG: hypothetical protein KIT46_04560 [Anaerolineales bacterium]|nr:hypothetical protein [Anaerolineales bacterium]MCW5855302.1 hypothetical protein [Anaerolineales bacterium]
MSEISPHSMPAELLAFRNTLRQADQQAFDQLYLAAAENLKLMDQLPLVIPLEKVLLAILIEQQKMINQLVKR